MEKSTFSEYLAKYMPKFANIYRKYNEQHKAPTYLFKELLTTRYSVDMKWESSTLHQSIVAADVVTMNSTLPLKKRDRISYATGNLPKIAMKLQLSEKQINDINVMIAKGTSEAEVARLLIDDALKCSNGIDERLEFLFLQALSNGVCLLADDTNPNVGIRADFGYLDENKASATITWGNANYTPISDIRNLIEKASNNGDTIQYCYLSREAYNLIRNSQEGKELAAVFSGLTVLAGSTAAKLPTPTPQRFNEAIKDELGIELVVIDRSVRVEKDGKQTSFKPFNPNRVILTTSNQLGSLVYGQLAEETNPSANATYTKATEWTLIKKWHEEEPFAEITSGQALAIPVIENANEIYSLKTIAD